MKKLTLDLDTLMVESFATGTAADAEGTVHGAVRELPTNSMNDQNTCYQNSCAGNSCYTCSICMTFDYMCNPANQFDELAPAE
ncbi:MAG: hypothetical protein JWM27_1220 [Gemmatimonadetes bacterium]|nr:hypothetical protein [Gemmatimonadota bacterium]